MASSSPIPFGRFELREKLGAGGMGEVFRAEMRGPDGFARRVVLKRMLPDLTSDPDAVAMFIDEARLAARLHHPGIVQVHDFGKLSGRYFLVMEPVDGCDLGRVLVHLFESKRRLPFGASVVVKALADVRRQLEASGLKLMAGTSGTILLAPEHTHGIWLEFRERR